MILLKANEKLKAVFQKIIKTMGENVQWDGIFLINNNDLILLGKVRSLFFNFDNKRAYSNIIDIIVNEDDVLLITENELLENTLNMTLYTFGKWGGIKGLRVEKDYDQLNKLLQYILQDVHIEAALTRDNLRFYRNNVLFTYEDVIQIILEPNKTDEDKEEEKQEEELIKQEEESNYSLGLWHKMVWKSSRLSFDKGDITEEDKVKSRLGNDFYMVNYKCPFCTEKLYMVVFPIEKEFRIETDEGGVYLARAYTCRECHSFFTPKPQKLISEQEVYQLILEEDSIAYDDYLELLGKQGRKTSNCNFNEYEEDYKNKKNKPMNTNDASELEELCDDIDSMSQEELDELINKVEAGFYPEEEVTKYYSPIESRLKEKALPSESNTNSKNNKKDNLNSENKKEKSEHKKVNIKSNKNSSANESVLEKGSSLKKEIRRGDDFDRTYSEQEITAKNREREKRNQDKSVNQEKKTGTTSVLVNLKDLVSSLLRGENQKFDETIEKLSTGQLSELKALIQSETKLEEEEKRGRLHTIDRYLYKENEKRVLEKAVASKDKNYNQILSVIEEVKSEKLADSIKESVLNSLRQLLEKAAKKELAQLISQVPEHVSKRQYEQFQDRLEAYKEVDLRTFKRLLEDKWEDAQKQEIAAFMKRENPRNRKAYLDVSQKLKEQGFEEQNVAPVFEKLHQKVYDMDVAALKRICNEPADLTFEEGIKAYEEILLGEYLPELKEDILGQLDKRLTKLKSDECEQLVSKLSKELIELIQDESRIYFYQARKMMRSNPSDDVSIIIHNALKTYAAGREKYEYPIVICDTSYARNGESGFILTPNHIYYKALMSGGVIDVMNVEQIYARTGLIGKGIYVNHKGSKTKISNALHSKQLKEIAKVLDAFLSYLQEKPESRNISYLAKEVHPVKCCYRCGYVYKEGSVCPKCGSKMNG